MDLIMDKEKTLYDRVDQVVRDKIIKYCDVSYDALEEYVNNGVHTDDPVIFASALKQIDRRLKINKIRNERSRR